MSAGFFLTPSIIYLNLGSEMMFVLMNRMKAQKINMEKAGNKILEDLIAVMFKKPFVDNILKPQTPLSIPTFFDLFTKIVNSSIMKLDGNSMEKLFYLILMTFKKQLFTASSPLEIYSLTIAHMRQVMTIVPDPTSKAIIQQSIDMFKAEFKNYGYILYLQIKEQILSMLESYHSRIILLVETGYQTDKGRMIHAPRNYHNKKGIGKGINHQDLPFQIPQQAIPFSKLDLEYFFSWKTDLAQDNYSDIRGSSKHVESKKFNSQMSKQKSMKDFLGLSQTDLASYQVQLDIFGDSPKKVQKVNEGPQKEKDKEIVMQKSYELVSKIAKQFEEVELKNEEEQEIDLLDMMDN